MLPTLSLYFARHFFVRIVIVFGFFFFVLLLADLIDLSRSVSNLAGVNYGEVILVSLFRAPSLSSEILPFIIFFAGLLSFSSLTRRLELVVARASGISAWRFLFPTCLVSVLLGVFSFTAYEPFSQSLMRMSQSTEARLFESGVSSSRSQNFWLRVGRESGDMIIRAHFSENYGRSLTGVYAWLYDSDGTFIDRFESDRAYYADGSYQFFNVSGVSSTGSVTTDSERTIPVTISESHLSSRFLSPDSVDFWQLRIEAENAELSSRSGSSFLTRFWSLCSHPLLFLAMTLFSACVCLGFSRSGVNLTVIWLGIFGSFVLYIVSRLVLTFGSNDLVSPLMSGLFPPLIGVLIGLTILLYREDG